MAFGPSMHAGATPFAISFTWRGRPRTWRLGRVAGLGLLAVLPILSAWYLGATAYLVFHDQLLASLITRQADMQYAYEDRIASLRTELDRQTSRALVDRQMIATTIRDLAARSQQLEARAATIDALVHEIGGAPRAAPAVSPGLEPAAPMPDVQGAPDLRLDRPASLESDAADKRADLSNGLTILEARQSRQLAALRDPTLRDVGRLQTALIETGLAPRLLRTAPDHGVGGPFVPLPDATHGSSFDMDVALLRDAVARRAELARIVRGVPLRRPLEGALEVTSPFGARLDPFYGRAAMHTGVDLMETYGGPVLATAAGTVTVAGSEGGYGNMVEIDHGNGLRTRYAHLSSIEVAAHQKIAAGAIVGLVGSTGRATGPHLHYETRVDGEPVDPTRFLRAGAGLFPG